MSYIIVGSYHQMFVAPIQFEEQLRQALHANSVQCSDEFIDRLVMYYQLTQKWGSKINITANLKPERFIAENILDPVLAAKAFASSPYVPTHGAWSFMDIGCGGGFVGVVWRLYFSSVISEMLLVDSDRKKINFCREVIRCLKLDKTITILARTEQVHNTSDIVVSRATWPPDKFCTEAARLVNPGGVMVHFTGTASIKTNPCVRSLPLLKYCIHPHGIRRTLTVFK